MIRLVLLRSPVVVVRGDAACRSCPQEKDHPVHASVAECPGVEDELKTRPLATTCGKPWEHHRYRAVSWRDRVRGFNPWTDQYL